MAYIGAGITRFNTADELTVTGTSEFGGNVSFGDNNITNVGSLQIDSIAGDADTNTNITFAGSDVITMTTAGSERLRLDASGNVGVGTASPSERVTIGANSSDTALSGTSNTQGLHLYARSFGIAQIDSLVSSSNNSGMSLRTYNNGTYTAFIENLQGNTTTFATAGSERMRIDSSGNVGISNTTPSSFFAGARNLVVGSGSGNQGMTIFSGTSSIGNIKFADGTGSDATKSAGGIRYDHSSNFMRFDTNDGTERMRIDSSGTLLVGKTSEAIGTAGAEFRASGHQLNMTRASGPALNVNRLTDDGDLLGFYQDSSLIGTIGTNGDRLYFTTASKGFYVDESGSEIVPSNGTGGNTNNIMNLGNSASAFKSLFLADGIRSDTMTFLNLSGTEAMRITSGGVVLIGVTSFTSGGGGIKLGGVGDRDFSANTTNAVQQIGFHNPNGEVGSIFTSGTSTSFATSSDYRLKEAVVDMTGATTRLKQLNPVRFNFIADADTTVDGFLAHEVQTVVPEAITGTHNEVDDDGNPVYQGIDQSKLVPLLVATIQELEARIAALEAE